MRIRFGRSTLERQCRWFASGATAAAGPFRRSSSLECECAKYGRKPEHTPVPGTLLLACRTTRLAGRPGGSGSSRRCACAPLRPMRPHVTESAVFFLHTPPLLFHTSQSMPRWQHNECRNSYGACPCRRARAIFRHGEMNVLACAWALHMHCSQVAGKSLSRGHSALARSSISMYGCTAPSSHLIRTSSLPLLWTRMAENI